MAKGRSVGRQADITAKLGSNDVHITVPFMAPVIWSDKGLVSFDQYLF